MAAYTRTFTRPNRTAPAAAAALAALALAIGLGTDVPAGAALRPHPRDTAPLAPHSPVEGPMARTVGAGDDPYEIRGDRRPAALPLTPQFDAYQLAFSSGARGMRALPRSVAVLLTQEGHCLIAGSDGQPLPSYDVHEAIVERIELYEEDALDVMHNLCR